jgi:CRP/FNR family transcriptional regulator
MSLVPTLHLPCYRSGNAPVYGLTPETLAELDAISAPFEYRNGETLMRQGDPAEFVRILCNGRAKISTASHDGRTLLLNIVNAGAVLGLVSAVRRMRYETTAEAYGPCTVIEVPDHDFLDFVFRHRNASLQVMQMLAAENHDLLVNARRVALSGTVAGNVAKLLLDWSTTVTGIDGNNHFNMVLTHQEIAEMVGTTRETVTRTLATFRRQGWIRIHGAFVEILQQGKMKEISI